MFYTYINERVSDSNFPLSFLNMKVICFILSIFIFVLTTIPCCADDRCDEEIMTEQNNKNSHESGKTKDCEHCSPFLSCGSCDGFVNISVIETDIPSLLFIDEQFISFSADWTSSFYTEFWQPPKIG